MKANKIKSVLLILSMTMLLPQTSFAKESYILPNSGKSIITESKLSKLKEKELLLARNEIAARHGKTFYTEEIKKYFEAQNWYTPSESYDDSDLTETEKENIDLIYQHELSQKQENAKKQFEENKRISANSDVQVLSSSWVYMDSPYYYEDLLGKWVDDSNPVYPKVFEFEINDGVLFYRYYGIFPGNGIGLDIANSYTEFEYCTGTFTLTPETGFINCHVNNSEKIYLSLQYNVMSDTLVETSMDNNRLTLTKNNDFTYEP